VVVLVLSLVFIFSVVALHGTVSSLVTVLFPTDLYLWMSKQSLQRSRASSLARRLFGDEVILGSGERKEWKKREGNA
jgi:hypothetical protein